MKKNAYLIIGFVMIFLIIVLSLGGIDAARRGVGFLFIPSHTPTETMTPTATNTPTSIPTDTMTPSPTLTETPTPTLTFTVTSIPTETPTVIPTVDQTALALQIYAEVTASAEAFALLLTPTITPIIPDAELYTGLRMVNLADGKELYYIKNEHAENYYGFWMDWNEVTNAEYKQCVAAGYCSVPQSDFINGITYYSGDKYQNYPVTNVSRGQAAAYCSWSGMTLPALNDWIAADEAFLEKTINVDKEHNGPWENDPAHSDFIGNVWEWLDEDDEQGNGLMAGCSWKTALQDVRDHRLGRMKPNQYSEDLGFRCIYRVSSR